jgi:hypothetical protein
VLGLLLWAVIWPILENITLEDEKMIDVSWNVLWDLLVAFGLVCSLILLFICWFSVQMICLSALYCFGVWRGMTKVIFFFLPSSMFFSIFSTKPSTMVSHRVSLALMKVVWCMNTLTYLWSHDDHLALLPTHLISESISSIILLTYLNDILKLLLLDFFRHRNYL